MHIDYSDVTVSYAIENNRHKQQCSIGHVNTMHFVKFIYIVCMFTSPHECGLYAHTI